MKKRLTVAHYKEDLTWLQNINKDIDIYIYHKGHGNNMEYNEIKTINNNEFLLSNTGREAQTYLTHIIENYNDIYDLEFFSQGSIVEYPNFIHIINENTILKYEQYSNHYCKFSCYNGYHKPYATINGNVYMTGEIRDIWNNLFDYEPPTYVEITPHALIKLNKENILMHDISIYKKCLDYFKDNEVNNFYVWNFEYFWCC